MSGNGAVTGGDLLGMTERRLRKVDLPAGRFLWIRNMSEFERARIEAGSLDDEGDWNRERAKLTKGRVMAICCSNDKGERLYTDDDAARLMELDSAVTSLIFNACVEHCGIGVTDLEKIAGNSNGDPPEC